MSTSAPDPAGEEAYAYLLTIGVPKLVNELLAIQGLAIDHGLTTLRTEISAIVNDLLDDLNRAAVQFAGLADGWIVAKMFESQSRNRPHTGNMETHVVSEPGPLGSVKVAMVSELDKIVNPNGYGPFWRAQEYGTGSDEVPSQEGRLLFGTFEPSGEPPEGAQQGLGQGHDLAFIPFGEAPGFGRISVELPGRHFLRDGATEAGDRYLAAMKEIQARTSARFKQAMASFTARQAGRTTVARIKA